MFNADDKYIMQGSDQIGSFITVELAQFACDAMNQYERQAAALERIRTWLIAPSLDAETIAEMRRIVSEASK